MPLIQVLRPRQQGSPSTSTLSTSTAANSSQSTMATPTSATSTPTPSSNPSGTTHSGPSSTTIIAVVVTIAAISAILFVWMLCRRTRRKHQNPKYVPGGFLKKLWEKWDPEPAHHRLEDTSGHLEPQRTTDGRQSTSSGRPGSNLEEVALVSPPPVAASTTNAAEVDRRASVRSIMTLPAYRKSVHENEQVIGREGERGGIDVVIEFPEGADVEESQREAEMEALYQVRLARRRENEEREERRRLRREARERGDYVALRELQARARAGSNTSRTVEEMRAEHARIRNERQRAISSVSYADLGVARHDGTRLRANSNDSEREGLLGDAASMAASSHYHRRDRSASSVISIDTIQSANRSRANSHADAAESPLARIPTSYSQGQATPNTEGRAGSSPEIIEHEDVSSPPGYENISLDTPHDAHQTEPPPDYSSPIVGRGEHRSPFDSPRESLLREASQRRAAASSHIGSLIDEQRASSPSNGSITPTNHPPGPPKDTVRAVSGSPPRPSLVTAEVPSIHVDSPSPTSRVEEESALFDDD